MDIFRSSKLGQVFDSTSASYKFYWLWGILDLLGSSKDGVISVQEIYARMAARAYTSVVYFRLRLGTSDKLPEIIEKLQGAGLSATASVDQVYAAAMVHKGLFEGFDPPVPTRLLSPWVSNPSGLRTSKLTTEIIRQANASKDFEEPLPYGFSDTLDRIIVGPRWRAFLLENRVAIEDFIKLRLVCYLEARNPHSSNITQKLALEATRDLKFARDFWARTLEQNRGRLLNIYTGGTLTEPFVVDHFIPFSFVAHDHLWNLIPTDVSSNAAKSDKLPDLAMLLPDYADAHYLGIKSNPSEALEDYCVALRVCRNELSRKSSSELREMFRQVLEPKLAEARSSCF